MEREQGNLESQSSYNQEGDANGNQVKMGEMGAQIIEIGYAGKTIDQAETIKQHCRSERTKEHIFKTSFGGFLVASKETRQYVKRDGRRLDCQVHHDQVRRRGHQTHAQGGRKQ